MLLLYKVILMYYISDQIFTLFMFHVNHQLCASLIFIVMSTQEIVWLFILFFVSFLLTHSNIIVPGDCTLPIRCYFTNKYQNKSLYLMCVCATLFVVVNNLWTITLTLHLRSALSMNKRNINDLIVIHQPTTLKS